MAYGKHRRKNRESSEHFYEFTTLSFWRRLRCKNQIWTIYHCSREKNPQNYRLERRYPYLLPSLFVWSRQWTRSRVGRDHTEYLAYSEHRNLCSEVAYTGCFSLTDSHLTFELVVPLLRCKRPNLSRKLSFFIFIEIWPSFIGPGVECGRGARSRMILFPTIFYPTDRRY